MAKSKRKSRKRPVPGPASGHGLIQVEDKYIKDLQQELPPVTDGNIQFTVDWLKLYEGSSDGVMGVSAQYWPGDDRYYWPLGSVTVQFKDWSPFLGTLLPKNYELKYPSGIFSQESTKNVAGGSPGPTLAEAPLFRKIIGRLFETVNDHHGVMDRATEIMEGPKANPIFPDIDLSKSGIFGGGQEESVIQAFGALSDKQLLEVIDSYQSAISQLEEERSTAETRKKIAVIKDGLARASVEAKSRGGRVSRKASRALQGKSTWWVRNPEPLIIVPKGRLLQSKVKTATAAMEAWNAEKDFMIQDRGSPWGSTTMSKRNAGMLMGEGYDQVQIRFNNNMDSVIIDLATNREVASANPVMMNPEDIVKYNPKRKASKRKASKKNPAKRKAAKRNPKKWIVSCPHCKARAGRPCVNPSGGNYGKPHSARTKKAKR